MKFLSVFVILMLSQSVSAYEQSLYTYDCEIEEVHTGFPDYFHLRQEFKKGIVVDKNLLLKQTEIIKGERKFDDLHVYETLNATFILGWGLLAGTGSGTAFIVKSNVKAKYSCSLDWSPY